MSCASQQKIVYTHIGVSDKPICTIEIVLYEQKKSLNTCRQIFLVDKDAFHLLKLYVKENQNDNRIFIVESMEYPYGTFYVTLFEYSKKYETIISKNESVVFFGNQLPLLRSNPELYNAIDVLQNRLK
jgi:hypothetical protein